MSAWKIEVEVADGDDFTAPRHRSVIEVEAASETEARLLAHQLAMTPQPGKPTHVQIVATRVSTIRS